MPSSSSLSVHALDPRSSVSMVQRALKESLSELYKEGMAEEASVSGCVQSFFEKIVDRREKNMVEMMTKIFKSELKEQTKALQEKVKELSEHLEGSRSQATTLSARLERSVNARNDERKVEFKRLLMLRQIFRDAGLGNVSSSALSEEQLAVKLHLQNTLDRVARDIVKIHAENSDNDEMKRDGLTAVRSGSGTQVKKMKRVGSERFISAVGRVKSVNRLAGSVAKRRHTASTSKSSKLESQIETLQQELQARKTYGKSVQAQRDKAIEECRGLRETIEELKTTIAKIKCQPKQDTKEIVKPPAAWWMRGEQGGSEQAAAMHETCQEDIGMQSVASAALSALFDGSKSLLGDAHKRVLEFQSPPVSCQMFRVL